MSGSIRDKRETPSGFSGRQMCGRQFAVMSSSGNAWRKFIYFLDLWAPHLDILLSIYDIYMSDRSIRDEILSFGIRPHIHAALRRTYGYLASKGGRYVRYRQRLERLMADPPQVRGLIAVDSGGFSLSTPEKISRLCCVKGDPEIVQLGYLLLQVDELERDAGSSTERYLLLAREAARTNIRYQLRTGADIVVSLDRVFDFNLPFSRREMRWLFSLECAREALITVRDMSGTAAPRARVLPVIHPLGPTPSKEAKPDEYYRYAREALRYLEEAERETGLMFYGVAIGSLVPLISQQLLLPVAVGVGGAILESSFRGRPIHAFGASNDKLELLWECGFNSFDTSHHLIKGRNRQSYIPAKSSYVPSKTLKTLPCYWRSETPTSGSVGDPCPVCVSVTLDEYLEDSPGLKEVATVLQSLHDFYSNHLARCGNLLPQRYGARL